MPQRAYFHCPAEPAPESERAQALLRLLLAQDGSTTRLCETIAAAAVEVLVQRQRVTGEVPAPVRELVPGGEFIERVVSIVGRGQVMLDAVSYIATERLSPELRAGLDAGHIPIGHLLSRQWARREFLPLQPVLCQPLWDAVGMPDMRATRHFRVLTPQGPSMLITEVFRRGMRMSIAPRDDEGRPHRPAGATR